VKRFIVYNSDGKILRTGTCADFDFSAQAQDGETVIEGEADDATQCVIDGVIQDATPAVPSVDEQRRQCSKLLRRERNTKLAKTDYTQMPDAPLTGAKKADWATYRQALRDLPSQYQDETDIDNVVYPTQPEA